MRFNKTIKSIMVTALSFGLSASAFALTPGSGTWVKEANLFGLKDAQVYVPSNPNPAVIGNGRALMLTLHGCGQTASGNVINKKFNWEATAEQYGMVVIAPTVPAGTTATRAYSGCWDWFGGNHSRTTRDEAILLKLVDAVKNRTNLDIDPKQIYVTGLSSGGGVVIDIACVAPDYFAGMGVNAGPALYTAANAGVGSKAAVSAQYVADTCRSIAGSYNASLATQLTSVVNGTADGTVDPSHDRINTEGMKIAYGATISNGSFTDVKSTGETWRDTSGKTRVSYVQATGMGHAWPAGAGGSGGGLYVDYTHINYPAYVTKFFFDNNLRVDRSTTTSTTNASTTTTAATTTTTSAATTTTAAVTTTTTKATTTTAKVTTTTAPATTTTTAATTTTTQAGASCYTSSNVGHVLAGRAFYSFGYVRAYGSYALLGKYSNSVTTTLKKSGYFYYTLGGC